MLKYEIGGNMKEFIDLLKEKGIELTDNQLNQFEIYYTELVEWNSKINLTAITEKRDVYIKHFFDSILVNKGCTLETQTLLDVGSGAGFPSIPLKIMYPELKITIIDSLNKRITFLKDLTKKLGIEATLIHGRAEEHPNKNMYDIVTARAVSNLRILGELCIPFVKPGGLFLSLKGPKASEELSESKTMLKSLQSTLEDTIVYKVDDSERRLLIIKKNGKSANKYPRRFSKIKSNPL